MNIDANKLAYIIWQRITFEHGNKVSTKSQYTIQKEIDAALKNIESSSCIIKSPKPFSLFEAGYKAYRQKVAESEHEYDEAAKMTARQLWNDYLESQSDSR